MSNTVTITGNLGAKPELKTTDKSSFIVFPVYTQNNYFDEASKSWQKADSSEIHDVIIFDNQNALYQLAQRFKKGDLVEVTGKLSYSKRPYKLVDEATGEVKEVSIKQANIRAYQLNLIYGVNDKPEQADTNAVDA